MSLKDYERKRSFDKTPEPKPAPAQSASPGNFFCVQRHDATRLTLLGYGEQATTHARAIAKVRALKSITVWGRSLHSAVDFAKRMTAELAIPVTIASSAESAVANADIVCTLTAASEPILRGAWIHPGTHINVVGSGTAGPVEVDNDLVVRSRFIADSRASVLAQGAEFLRARSAGLIDDTHIVARHRHGR